MLGAEHIHEFARMGLHALRGRTTIFVRVINIMEQYN